MSVPSYKKPRTSFAIGVIYEAAATGRLWLGVTTREAIRLDEEGRVKRLRLQSSRPIALRSMVNMSVVELCDSWGAELGQLDAAAYAYFYAPVQAGPVRAAPPSVPDLLHFFGTKPFWVDDWLTVFRRGTARLSGLRSWDRLKAYLVRDGVPHELLEDGERTLIRLKAAAYDWRRKPTKRPKRPSRAKELVA